MKYDTRYIMENKGDGKVLLRNTGCEVMTTWTTSYNCGSFALGIFDRWYRPYNPYDVSGCAVHEWQEDYDEGVITYDECCNGIADIMIDYMVSTLPNVRAIAHSSQLKEDEYLVAFKAAYDDFHYARRMDNGEWFHKMGYTDIEKISEDDVYDDGWWEEFACEYCGDLRFLAVKKPNFKLKRVERKIANSTKREK